MRRIKPCWKSPSPAVGRQRVNSHATCVWARARLWPTGRRYPAGSLCDAFSVSGRAGKSRLPAVSITLLSTVSARTATADGQNGRGGADRVLLAREPSLPRQMRFSTNLYRDQVRLPPTRAGRLNRLRQGLHQNAVRRRPLKIRSPMLGALLRPAYHLLIHLLRDPPPVPIAALEACM